MIEDREELYRRALGVEGRGMSRLVAAGGLCAPLTPMYQMVDVTSMSDPLRKAIPVLKIARGFDIPPELILGGDA